jgi:hypothetical protein
VGDDPLALGPLAPEPDPGGLYPGKQYLRGMNEEIESEKKNIFE